MPIRMGAGGAGGGGADAKTYPLGHAGHKSREDLLFKTRTGEISLRKGVDDLV